MNQTDSDHTAALLLKELESIRVLLDAAAMPVKAPADPGAVDHPVPAPDDSTRSTTERPSDQTTASAEDISALTDAVKTRIDQTISNWLDDVVARNMVDLRSRLTALADEELERTIELVSERKVARIDPPPDTTNPMDSADG